MRDLLEREVHDGRAAEAVALFCDQVKKLIGAFAAALAANESVIPDPTGPIVVRVIRTDEEQMMAKTMCRVSVSAGRWRVEP